MVFEGTHVVRGSGEGVVVGTRMATELGPQIGGKRPTQAEVTVGDPAETAFRPS